MKYRWKIFKEFLGWDTVSEIGIIREEGEEGQLTKRGINFFSLSNNAGTIWSGNLTFTQSGEKRKKRIARVRNFRRRILDFRTNIEQFSCRKKCDGYWTRIWWRANIKVLRRIKILGGEKYRSSSITNLLLRKSEGTSSVSSQSRKQTRPNSIYHGLRDHGSYLGQNSLIERNNWWCNIQATVRGAGAWS